MLPIIINYKISTSRRSELSKNSRPLVLAPLHVYVSKFRWRLLFYIKKIFRFDVSCKRTARSHGPCAVCRLLFSISKSVKFVSTVIRAAAHRQICIRYHRQRTRQTIAAALHIGNDIPLYSHSPYYSLCTHSIH